MSISDAYKPNLKKAGKLFGNALGSAMSIPSNIRRARADADYKAIKQGQKVPDNVPAFDISGKVTEGYKTKFMANVAKERVLKRAKKLSKKNK